MQPKKIFKKKPLFSFAVLLLATITAFSGSALAFSPLAMPGESTRQTKEIAPGITYSSLTLTGEPYGTQNVFITKADLANQNVYVTTAMGAITW